MKKTRQRWRKPSKKVGFGVCHKNQCLLIAETAARRGELPGGINHPAGRTTRRDKPFGGAKRPAGQILRKEKY